MNTLNAIPANLREPLERQLNHRSYLTSGCQIEVKVGAAKAVRVSGDYGSHDTNA
jgi:hypothetical protein